MILIPAQFWLEKMRLWVQGGWFLGFGLALGFSLLVLQRPQSPALRAWSRGLWVAAMLGFVAMWMAGPVLELMRRAVGVSGLGLLLALGAFSVLLAGVLSLVREWFGPTGHEPLRGEGVALSLLVLTLAGWWFGGVSLELNSLWTFAPPNQSHAPLPDGWALSLGGATLLGLSHLVRSPDETVKRVLNPRAATWWIFAFALALTLPWRGQNGPAASVFLAGAGPFACKMWRARADGPRFLRVNARTRAVLLFLLCMAPLGVSHNFPFWLARVKPVWNTPLYDWALAAMVLAAWALFEVRRELRAAFSHRFPPRLLLHATLAGTLAATLLFGPAGTPFFAFWPLCGLFFDLLCPREYPREPQLALGSEFDRSESQRELEAAAANARAT